MKIFNFIKDFFATKKEDVYLISFPKSGNTRFRMALAKYYQLKYEVSSDLSYDWVNVILPAVGLGNIIDSRQKIKDLSKGQKETLFIKSHLRYPVLKYFMKDNKVIYIQRPDVDTIMSFYDYSQARNIIRENVTFSEFLRDPKYGISAFKKHLAQYNTITDNIVDYKELMENDIDVITKSLTKAKVQFDISIMKKAIIETRRNNVVKINNKLDKDGYNFAAKRERHLNDYFTQKDVEYYNEVVQGSILKPIMV